ncbi:MBL fold metallo-hydrolase, partial [Chloroflexota bacterium]
MLVNIKEVAREIYLIDDNLYSLAGCGCVYLINEEKKALIDAGPTNSASLIIEGINKVGINPEEIDYIIVTHIHLDHAGGAGVLLQKMPKAQVMVHRRGIKHLVDPDKLMKSMIAVQGEGMLQKVGEMVPIPAERVEPVYDEDKLRLSEEQQLQFMETPGHAPHELCIYESRNNGVFTGDSVGSYFAEYGIIIPDTPPPNFDLENYVNTLKRLMSLNASSLYLPHFGINITVSETLQLVIDRMRAWDDMVTESLERNEWNSIEEKLITRGCDEIKPAKSAKSLYEHLRNNTICW